MAKKSSPRDPNLDHPAVKLYIDICRSTPNHIQRAAIVAKIEKLDLWEQILRQFMLESRPAHRVDWTLERYGNALPTAVGKATADRRPPTDVSPEEEAWMRTRTRLA